MVQRTVNVNIENLVVRATRDQASGKYVGVCDALKLVAEGQTFVEMITDMNAAIQDLFRVLVEDGELDEFFRRAGWQKMIPIVPQRVSVDELQFDVPFNIDRAVGPVPLHA
jgi:hypothetical protein